MKITICLDTSSYTEKILDGMKSIVMGFTTPEITVLHIIDETMLYATTGAETQINETLQNENQQLADLCKQYFGADINYIAEYGQPKLKSDEMLATLSFDLLVVGAHSHQNFENRLLGSFAEHLLQNSRKPILVVPV